MSDTLASLLSSASAPNFVVEAHDKSFDFDVPDKDYLMHEMYPIEAYSFLPHDTEINLYPPHEVPMRVMFNFNERGMWGTMIAQWWEEDKVDSKYGTYIDLILFISEDGNNILVGKGEKDNDGVYRIVVSESTKWKEWAPIPILPPALYWACKNLIFEPKCDLPL